MSEKELLQEKLAHLETKRALWQTQGQLLSILMQQSRAEEIALQASLKALEPAPET